MFFSPQKKQYLFPPKKIQVPSPPSADRDPERPRRDLPVCWRDVVGWSLWTLGFVVQFTADVQKRIFTADPRNANRWINVGLWRWAQHPNYFGEMCIFGLNNKKMRWDFEIEISFCLSFPQEKAMKQEGSSIVSIDTVLILIAMR